MQTELALVLACTFSVALSSASLLWCALFSGPASLRKLVDTLGLEIASVVRRIDTVEAGFIAHRAEISGIAEAIEGTLESVERKRRQTAAAASRINGGRLPDNAAAPSRDEIVTAARQRVYGGSP